MIITGPIASIICVGLICATFIFISKRIVNVDIEKKIRVDVNKRKGD